MFSKKAVKNQTFQTVTKIIRFESIFYIKLIKITIIYLLAILPVVANGLHAETLEKV